MSRTTIIKNDVYKEQNACDLVHYHPSIPIKIVYLLSISGFILEIVIPSRHAVKFQGVTPWSSQLLGLGRHDWGEIHLWAGIVLVILLTIHILLHINIVSAFVKKKCPNHILQILLYILFLMLLIMTIMPWLVYL